jgi:polyisoprenoid-binding protein YceI
VPSRRPLRWLRWTVAAVAAVVVLAVGGTYVYIHFIEGPAPAPFSLKSATTPPSATASTRAQATGAGQATSPSLAGTWRVAAGSQAGYRVKEVLLGQNNIAVGRTSHVNGHLTINGSTVTAAAFTVKMATIHSDQSQRDGQFDGRIMAVASYPTGTFTLTRPISLAPVPATAVIKTYSATGKLTLHGHTQQVTFGLKAERTGTKIKVTGSIPIKFADYGIGNPSFGSFVTTQNHGTLEFLLDFTRS